MMDNNDDLANHLIDISNLFNQNLHLHIINHSNKIKFDANFHRTNIKDDFHLHLMVSKNNDNNHVQDYY
jgi:hypothetical protein